jgi:8-oxo-dGTP pyrophosphatase MutT (NUDIX family)
MDTFDYQKCGVVIVWIGGKIMLCERKEGKFKGCFGVAGGKIEKNESVLRGTCREFYEETGAFLYSGDVEIIDCYILPDGKQKVFVFESSHNETFKIYIKNTEPLKHGKWNFYTKQEALKINLMPYIRQYLEKV